MLSPIPAVSEFLDVRDIGFTLENGRWRTVEDEDEIWKKDFRDQLALNTVVDSTDGREMILTTTPRFSTA